VPSGQMSSNGLTSELQAFVLQHVDSIEQLEVLLLLHAQSGRTWTAAEVSLELRSAPESVANRLKSLVKTGLLVQVSQPETAGEAVYRYQPASDKAESLLQSLTEAYRTRRFTVINLILSRPPDSIKTFADAFRIKKETNTDG
jgi:predicted transcriptional regulator